MKSLRAFYIALLLMIAATHPAISQAWIPLVNQPNPNLALSNPLLLTDGTVIAHQACGPQWWRLTPDQYGSYINGTWKRIASLPAGYGPLYFGSAVLPDGRVIMMGGEDNGTPDNCQSVWTNLGAIYDPTTNKWTSVTPPTAGPRSETLKASFSQTAPTCRPTAAPSSQLCWMLKP
jgi:hypothetical protein